MLRCMEVRIALEGQAARLAAARHTGAQPGRMTTALEAMRNSFPKGTPPTSADYEFHAAVAAGSGNALFGLGMDRILQGVERRLTAWQERA